MDVIGQLAVTPVLVASLSVGASAEDDPVPELGPTGSPCHQDVVIRSCGETAMIVRGRAVQRDPIGSFRPVRGASIARRIDDPRSLESVKARSSRAGEFRFTAHLPSSVQTRCEDGVVRRSEVVLSRTFVLSARDCNDVQIEVTEAWKPHDIVMTCAQSGP